MYKNEIGVSELRALDYNLRGDVLDDPRQAVFHTLMSVDRIIGANVTGFAGARNSLYMDRSRRTTAESRGITVHGSLRVKCADKVIQLSRRMVEYDDEKVAELKIAAELEDGIYRCGSEVVKVWEHAGTRPELVVVAKRINNGKLKGVKSPAGQLQDDFLIDAGPVLKNIVGQELDETTDFCFVARLVQDYLRSELSYTP